MRHTREEYVLELDLQLLLLCLLKLGKVDEEEDVHALLFKLNGPPHAVDQPVVDHDLYLLLLCRAGVTHALNKYLRLVFRRCLENNLLEVSNESCQ